MHLLPLASFSGAESINVDLPLKNALFLSHSAPRETSSIQYFQGTKIVGPLCLIKPNLQEKFSLLFTSHKETGQRLKMTTDIKVEIKPMLVSSVRGSCAPIGHTGLRRASDDAYSLREVVQFRAPNCAFERQFALLFHRSWLAVLSIEVGKFLSVAVPGVVAALWVAVDT